MTDPSTSLVQHHPPSSPSLELLDDGVHEYRLRSKSANTKRAYASDLAHFEAWCRERGLVAIPASDVTVCRYLVDHANKLKPSTLQRRLSAISQAHQTLQFESPVAKIAVRQTWAGIKRSVNVRQEGKQPLSTADIRRMVATLPDTPKGVRDRALLLLGYAGALRRSELVGLATEDVEDTELGLIILLRRSKTDQEGEGRKVAIPYGGSLATCPVRSYRAWLNFRGDCPGALFPAISRHGQIGTLKMTAQSVALVVKHTAASAGLEQAKFAGHSLRAGHATTAAAAGVSERAIVKTTGHRSTEMVRRYIRDGELFRENSGSSLGL